jgi:hypothetical protein
VTSDDGSYPYVCPSCYAVGGEPCAVGCREEAARRAMDAEEDGVDRDGLEDDDDETFLADFMGPSGALDVAAAEVSLAEQRLEEKVERLILALRPAERAALRRRFELDGVNRYERGRTGLDRESGFYREGDRSCRWCRELVRTDFDHDFCEPEDDEETAPILIWSSELRCTACLKLHPVTLAAPPFAVERKLPTSTTVECGCGHRITVCYSWWRKDVVGLRYEPPRRPA